MTQAEPRPAAAVGQGAMLLFGGDLTSLLLKALDKCCGEKPGAALASVNMACAKAVKSHHDLMERTRSAYNDTVKEHLVSDLGSLPDDVLIDIDIALRQEAHRGGLNSRRISKVHAQARVLRCLAASYRSRAARGEPPRSEICVQALQARLGRIRLSPYGRFRLASAAAGSHRPLQAKVLGH